MATGSVGPSSVREWRTVLTGESANAPTGARDLALPRTSWHQRAPGQSRCQRANLLACQCPSGTWHSLALPDINGLPAGPGANLPKCQQATGLWCQSVPASANPTNRAKSPSPPQATVRRWHFLTGNPVQEPFPIISTSAGVRGWDFPLVRNRRGRWLLDTFQEPKKSTPEAHASGVRALGGRPCAGHFPPVIGRTGRYHPNPLPRPRRRRGPLRGRCDARRVAPRR